MTIDIIGAGIGGLTTAIALKKEGFKVRVFERAHEIKPVGAGIVLANNAMQVYKKLGLHEQIENLGNHVSALNITTKGLSTISGMDLHKFEKIHKVRNIAIHRGSLQLLLADQLEKDELHLDAELKNISHNEDSLALQFDNEKSVQSSLLIGADGIHSRVRDKLFGKCTIRKARQTCWRGVTDYELPETHLHALFEAWGHGDRFGFVQIAPQKVYWYALKSFDHIPDEYSISDIPGVFETYHEIIRDLIQNTKKESIHTAEIADLKPIKTWYQGNACLLGDAAHATTPNLGQGACQAIEDAYVLAQSLKKHDAKTALAIYQKTRKPKALDVVNTSWTLGKMANWKNPAAIYIRNTLMKWTPQSVNEMRSKSLFRLSEI